jgi:putative FmdB family regulatory protein
MPVYEYEHREKSCSIGKLFEVEQRVDDAPLVNCPACGGAVRKLISLVSVNTPKSNTELRDLGFTKLVKKSDGNYENVTARKGESRIMERGKSGTVPDFSKTITD